MQYKNKCINTISCGITGLAVTEADNRVRRTFYKKLIASASRNLTKKQQEVMLMYYFEEYNITQISQELKIAPSTVCRRLQRAVAAIKKYADIINDLGIIK